MSVPTLVLGRAPIVDEKGNATRELMRKLQEWDNKLNGTISQQGEILATLNRIGANATVEGRSGTLQSGIANLSAGGVLNSLANVADTSTDHLTDGTGTPLTGGIRAAVAIDTNNRLTNSFRQNPVDVSSSPLSSAGLSNDGLSTVITIAADNYQFGPSPVAYHSGSVDPGVFGGPYIIYFDDPTFAGGAVTFHFTTNPSDTVGALGRIPVGSITTVNGAAKTGGGYSGGTGGKGGGRGYSGL